MIFSRELFFYLPKNYSFIYTGQSENLKARILESIITWSEMGQQTIQAKEVYCRGEWNKALSDFWKMSRQAGMKYLPALVTVYSCLHYCPKELVIKNTGSFETKTKTIVNCENCW